MTVAKAFRFLLAGGAILLLVWAFADFGRRIYQRHAMAGQRPVVLTMLHWGSKDEDAIVEKLVREYEAEHTDTRIVRINAPDVRSKLKTMFSAGTPPDLFYLPPDMLAELASLKLIAPLDGYLDADRGAGNGALYDDFYPLLMKAFRYDAERGEVGVGPLYGLPKDWTSAVIYANLDLVEAAGVDWKSIQANGWTWQQYEDAAAKITALRGDPKFSGRKVYGGFLDLWPDTLRHILWTFGGDYFGKKPDGSPDFRDVTLDEPAAQEALSMIKRTRQETETVYNPTGQSRDGGAEFLGGNIGFYGPVGRWQVPKMNGVPFRWDVLPTPATKPEYRTSQIYLTAWTMSSSTKHPAQVFDLIKFLCGPEGGRMQSRLGLAIPPMKSVAESDDFLRPPGISPHKASLYLDELKTARLQQVPREAEWTRIVDDNSKASLQLGSETTLANAKRIESMWLSELNSPLRQQKWPAMNWRLIGTITAAAVVVIVVGLYLHARREKLGPLDKAQQRTGFAFIAPWLIGFFALTLGPMIVSLLLSFTRWTGLTPMGDAESVGMANFQQMVNDKAFQKSLRVTAYFVILAVPITQVMALAVALLMNLRVKGITLFRTIYFVPSVVSGVALAMLWLQLFNNDYGLINRVLRFVVSVPPDWFGKDANHAAIPAFVIMTLWGVGGGMIIYLAGLKGISRSLYEAAYIDGAGPMKRLLAITIPMLSPLIFYNLVMGIIGSFQVFTQAYVMTGAGPDNSTLFYVLNLYRQAFEFHNMGYASALAWVLFVLVLILTMLVFRGSRGLVHYEGLKT